MAGPYPMGAVEVGGLQAGAQRLPSSSTSSCGVLPARHVGRRILLADGAAHDHREQEWGTHLRAGSPVLGVKPHLRPGSFRPNPTAHLTGVGGISHAQFHHPCNRRATRRHLDQTQRLRSLLVAPLLAAGLVASTGSALSPAAAATPSLITASFGATAVRIAAAQKGDPYRYGAEGPSSFDCSGLVYYVYKTRLGKYLPRTASAQRLATAAISKSSIRPGDLVFFTSSGRVYHVGIYAGYNKVWHSPRPGQAVQLSTLWTSSWVAGRVR